MGQLTLHILTCVQSEYNDVYIFDTVLTQLSWRVAGKLEEKWIYP